MSPAPSSLSLGKLHGAPATAATPPSSSSSTAGFHAVTHATAAPLTAKVHLVALLSILDHWTHRNLDSTRVVGALLGSRSADGLTIHVTDAFPIALLDNDTSIDMDFADTMYTLRRRTNAKELVLGWYSTGSDFADSTTSLHHWFEDNLMASVSTPATSPSSVVIAPTPSAIHLLVDTSLSTNDIPIRGFIGAPIASLTDGNQGRMFIPLPTTVSPADHELSALETIATAALPSNNNLAPIVPRVGIPQAHGRIAKLDSLIDGCIGLVHDTLDQLLDNQHPQSPDQARKIKQLGHALRKVVQLRTHAHDVKAIDAEIRDLKTIMELATQARKQIQLTELIMYGAAYKH